MLIEINDISKSYNKNIILDHVSMKMESGKIYGLTGRNGSGKTMIMKCLCGLVIPDSGTIVIDGEEIGRNLKFPDSVGVLIENPGFIEYYSAMDNLLELASIRGIATKEDIIKLLDEVGLDYTEKKRVKKYSLGMRQKLGIAMAFLEEPDLIILDEPFNALDEVTEKNIIQMMIKRREQGKLIVMSCHDSDIIGSIADEIYEIKNGRIIS